MSPDRFTVITRDIVLVVLMVFACVSAFADTIAELQQEDKLRIRTWLEPAENINARQQVKLLIEVATDKWFNGGTRIGRFEIKDAIVMQREKFAVNSTRSEGSKSWTVQQWTLVVYPQRDGLFEIPAIPIQLSVAGEGIESIVGEVSTQPMSFEGIVPEQMQGKTTWIASNRFEVGDSFNKDTEALAPGDALIRTISFSADNLPAMMLPDVKHEGLQGIAVYIKPPQLTDKVNRGDYVAERTEVITYVFEKAGEYLLPKQVYHWWNLETQSLESIELEEHTLIISGMGDSASPVQGSPTQASLNRLVESLSQFKVAGIVLLAVISIWLIVRKFVRSNGVEPSAEHEPLSEAALRKQFKKACAGDDYEKAIGLFYRWLDNFAGEPFKGSVREQLKEFEQDDLTVSFKAIMREIYTSEKGGNIDLKSFVSQFIDALEKKGRTSDASLLTVDLKLN